MMMKTILILLLCLVWTDDSSGQGEPFILPDHYNEYLDIKTGYGPATGKWFNNSTGGSIGYTLSSGVMGPGENVLSIVDDYPLEKTLRFRLSELDKNYKPIAILDELLITKSRINAPWSPRYTSQLSEKEDMLYLLSVEALSTNEEIEDTILSVIYVPDQELKAKLSLDKQQYTTKEKPILKITNHGAVVINCGLTYYTEIYNGSDWEYAPIERVFPMPMITLKPGESYEQNVQIHDLVPGKYRIYKDAKIEGINERKLTPPIEFEVVEL
jgi:hypothetical protein